MFIFNIIIITRHDIACTIESLLSKITCYTLHINGMRYTKLCCGKFYTWFINLPWKLSLCIKLFAVIFNLARSSNKKKCTFIYTVKKCQNYDKIELTSVERFHNIENCKRKMCSWSWNCNRLGEKTCSFKFCQLKFFKLRKRSEILKHRVNNSSLQCWITCIVHIYIYLYCIHL